MAIGVICPGCMTSFEVDDRFAGKKGPCPKCGHIIEIPKEKLVVHAPDGVTSGGKTKKLVGHDARPILQQRFAFTGKQVFWGVMGTLGAAAFLFLIGCAHSHVLSMIVGILAAFGIAFPIADFGYMLIRDDDDLEMFLGNERHKRALFASLVFAASWIAFEIFVAFLGGQGVMACLYLIPIAAVGSFGALIFFDCNFGKALLVYLLFAFAAIIGRGLLFMPNGWIWKATPVATAPNVNPKVERSASENSKNEQTVEKGAQASESTNKEDVGEQGESSKLTKEAPKPRIKRRR